MTTVETVLVADPPIAAAPITAYNPSSKILKKLYFLHFISCIPIFYPISLRICP
jgi:hypothetical protein